MLRCIRYWKLLISPFCDRGSEEVRKIQGRVGIQGKVAEEIGEKRKELHEGERKQKETRVRVNMRTGQMRDSHCSQ